jgi:hypothetical protein
MLKTESINFLTMKQRSTSLAEDAAPSISIANIMLENSTNSFVVCRKNKIGLH